MKDEKILLISKAFKDAKLGTKKRMTNALVIIDGMLSYFMKHKKHTHTSNLSMRRKGFF